MDYEKKYKEANDKVAIRFGTNVAKEIFTDLYESEDERIRKELIAFLKTYDTFITSRYISWLEKQNSNVDNANKKYWRGYREGKQEILDKYAELEKQVEQKPYGQRKECYDCQFNYAGECKGSCPMKRNEIDKDKAEIDHCFTKMMNGEKVSSDEEEYNGEDYGIDGLWHAMNILEKTLGKVSGYQTDDGFLSHQCAITAVKKLYKKKPVEWSEEDEKMIDDALNMIEWYDGKNEKKLSDWFKSLKDRVQPKQEWSKEDEEMFKSLKTLLDNASCHSCTKGVDKILSWLKSLKPQKQWKPSDEQMDALNCARWNAPFNIEILDSLYNDLKKLTE